MSYTDWNIPRGGTNIPRELLSAGLSPLLAAILAVRGLDTPDAARRFLDCGAGELSDPLLLTDMAPAVERLKRAVETGEKVAVYGDYDVDGITSSCMLADYLRSLGLDCRLYIPDRMDEGYGVNSAAIRSLHDQGVSLIVTVDCGVTTVEEAGFAASIGVDMIITDHHECRPELPAAVAVVDPKRPDCLSEARDLAGVGVAFKLLCAMEGGAEDILARYADLVAVGTIADVMPLTGENRYIVKRGLQKLAANPRPGLRALIDQAGLSDRRINASGVGFTLAPRLNASGRLGRVETAIDLLLSESCEAAESCAADLCRLNRDRQTLESQIWREALEMIGGEAPTAPIVLAAEGWHQGVIGIAASKLTEAFNLPAVMICLDGEKGKGSCRSFGDFNIFEALSACGQYLEGFGGHAQAAGLTIRRENIDAFREAMARYYRGHVPSGGATLDIDVCVDSPELLSMRCVEDMDLLEPCGAGNPRPQLCIESVQLAELTPIGGGRHLKLRLEKFGQSYDAVYFSHTAAELGLKAGDRVDAAFLPQINEFRSRRSVQLLINGLRRHNSTPAAEILSGRAPETPRPQLLPERRDFAAAWQGLLRQSGRRAPLAAMLDAVCPAMWDEKLAVCLAVFRELGLLEAELEGGALAVRCRSGGEKVDLNSSRILAELREKCHPNGGQQNA